MFSARRQEANNYRASYAILYKGWSLLGQKPDFFLKMIYILSN